MSTEDDAPEGFVPHRKFAAHMEREERYQRRAVYVLVAIWVVLVAIACEVCR